MKKFLFIVGDGMADRKSEIRSYTPLEWANAPNMDYIATEGTNGLLNAIAPGITPGSAEAHLSIFGYDTTKITNGRGFFEALGAGMSPIIGDIAFRCNFATINKEFEVIDARAGRIRERIRILADLVKRELNEINGVELLFQESIDFRGSLILRGKNTSSEIICPKIMQEGAKAIIEPANDSRSAIKTAKILNEFMEKSYELLRDHSINVTRKIQRKFPANVVIPWKGGYVSNLKAPHNAWNLKGACVGAVSLIKGLCKFINMTVVDVPEATGYIDTDVHAKARAALNLLEDHELVLLHVEGPDEAGHDGDFEGKVEIIEKIDGMIGWLLDQIAFEELYIILLSDHATPVDYKDHTADPTPISIYGTKIKKDKVKEFSENAVSKGDLSRICGKNIMPLLFELTK
jgi:2,3-bisphosphoglycerate-independent phosphoglycerate mutase